MMRAAFLGIACIAYGLFATAQQSAPVRFCATEPVRLSWLEAYQQTGMPVARSNNKLYLPVVVHIVRSDEGKSAFRESQILDAFCALNAHFAASEIEFILQQPFLYPQNSDWYDHSDGQTAYTMMRTTRVRNAINTYFVLNAADACGYTLREQSTGLALGIALSASCSGMEGNSWAHEMGHYFSLPHTFHGWENYPYDYNKPAPFKVNQIEVEKADRSNCRSAGDGFCDTPADYLNGLWYCNEQSQSPIIQKDPGGIEFRSDGTLLMSYSGDRCAKRFSVEQQGAMRFFILQKLSSLLQREVSAPITQRGEIESLRPVPGAVFGAEEPVVLSWKPMPGISHYLVEVSPIPSFSFVTFSQIVSDSSCQPDLVPGRSYFWRIRPFNGFSTCPSFSKPSPFSISTVTAQRGLQPGESFVVFPNPCMPGELWTLELDTRSSREWQMTLCNALGNVLWSAPWAVTQGWNRRHLPDLKLPAGTYFLYLRSGDRQIVRKLMLSPSL